MNKQIISILVKTAIIFLAITGLVCSVFMPTIASYILPGFSHKTITFWSIFLIIAALPCFFALVPAWRIASNIASSSAFCFQNAKFMRQIGIAMAINAIYLAIGNVVYFVLRISFLYLFGAFFLIIAIFFALAVCSFSLSYLIKNATELQIQSDLTI